ncbi:lipocalin family protein [Pedobacter jamesrossensis]|uniref:Lipocalin family protein n=1 Tax=Pedobacter jamesrossensis TaxID=1908238 RepID=A0ABV8NSL6_9SPHI
MKTKYLYLSLGTAAISLLLLQSCAVKSKDVIAVKNFNSEKYLGKWYEIARFDYSFEKNMDNTTAEYALNPDGSIKVINKGFNYKKNKWSSAQGKAKFIGSKSEAKLKVSFFGPFYGGYNIVSIDKDYQNALIYGSSTKYIWLLSRTPKLDSKTKEAFLAKARQDGYNTGKLIWVKHDKD